MNEPVELSYDECRDLLVGGVVGRVAMCTPTGPIIVPVNYSVVGKSIVFRTTSYGVLGRHSCNTALAFEVDHLDYENQRGWSVVAAGRGRMVEDSDELAEIKAAWDPRPWAGGNRPFYVSLDWQELTGRRTGTGWTYANEMPVRRTV
jgi:uncharacterized protein